VITYLNTTSIGERDQVGQGKGGPAALGEVAAPFAASGQASNIVTKVAMSRSGFVRARYMFFISSPPSVRGEDSADNHGHNGRAML
jgi:hypothetical protein